METTSSSVILEKLRDAITPGFTPEFDPGEAEEAGAFKEDAITLADALDSTADMVPDETDAKGESTPLRLVSDGRQ